MRLSMSIPRCGGWVSPTGSGSGIVNSPSTWCGRLFSGREYFVREKLRPALRGLLFQGLDSARPSAEAVEAVRNADVVVIGPSNPLISIGPITALLGVHLDPARTVAISPLVAGRALKGPTAEMMRTLRGEASAQRVAEEYRALARLFILDTLDADRAPAVEALGYRVLVTDTVMESPSAARRLAAATLEFARPAL
jgi:LPPG:FO 2-phospho-L-lactate transferase